ncbi:hypothetical protein [Aminobacter sp. Piv2-1]|uniref:hypothetical protein n=1 Tax=Aminobacter sp. Piv2-1 TaxID=3031122 RepID=UPI0030B62F0D
MQSDVARFATRSSNYFSIGALVGSVFVGLWVGGGVFLVLRELVEGYSESTSRFPMVVAGAAFWSLLAALVATLPVSMAVAGLTLLLARLAHARQLPKVSGFGLLGAMVGTVLAALLVIADILAGNSIALAVGTPLIIAGVAGGALAGVIYRALLVYRYPALNRETLRQDA